MLLAGIIYIILGASFYYSPLMVIKLAVKNVNDTWVEVAKGDELIAPIYHLLRGFAAMMVTSGMTMIMPLFDPLKYRLLIYFNGVIFPFLSAIMLIKTGLSLGSRSNAGQQLFQGSLVHKSMIGLGLLFFLIFLSCFISLFITRKDAKEGKE